MKTIYHLRDTPVLKRLSILLITAALIAGLAGCGTTNGTVPDTHPFAGGSGTTADPYHITNWTQLDAVRNYLDKNFIIMNDLDSTTAGYEELAGPNANGEKGWEPIGTVAFGVDPIPWTHYIPFEGSLEGQGYEVSDLFIDRPEENHIGLFGYISKGVITDVGVVNAAVTGQSLVGSLLGWNRDGTVHNAYATGSVTGSGRVGGLVGDNWGVVSNCYATTDATGESSVGGLVGRAYGTVTNCYYNYDEVLINGQNVITTGALFGEDFEEWLANDRFLDVTERLSQEDGYYVINDASDLKQLLAFGQDSSLKFRLKNDLDLAGEPGLYIPYLAAEFDGNGHKISNLSFSFDFVSQVGLFGRLAASGKVIAVCVENVSLTGHDDVGGLVGYNWGTVSNSYATGSVTGEDDVGGLAGSNAGTVSNSYASVNVAGDEYVGGLVGENWSTVTNAYATGNVMGAYSVGGLVGYNSGTVRNCYATGSVTGGTSSGGLVQQGFGTVSNSFWDIETSGQDTSAGGTGKTTAEMQDFATFTDTATEGLEEPWDIVAITDPDTRDSDYIWNIVDGETYPFLSGKSVSHIDLKVPDDYETIQQAIDAASPGDTIYVRNGTYHENVVVDKSITLMGENREATIIDGGGTGKVVTIQADYVSITGFTIRNSGSSSSRPSDAGIYLYYADHCSINNTIVTNNFDGFWFEYSTYNTIQNSVVSHNSQIGINIGDRSSSHNKVLNSTVHSNGSGIQAMAGSHYTEIADVEMYNNDGNSVRIGWSQHWVIRDSSFYESGTGISIDTALNGIVTNCDIYSNTYGIGFWGWGPYYNTISNNTIHSNEYGINFACQARYNVVKDNDIFNNDYGVYIGRNEGYPSYDNQIYHNNFIDNGLNAKDDEDRYTNYWDDGYPGGGNYWSDYQERYPDAEELDDSGIWDTPYSIDVASQDGYPLMNPWTPTP